MALYEKEGNCRLDIQHGYWAHVRHEGSVSHEQHIVALNPDGHHEIKRLQS